MVFQVGHFIVDCVKRRLYICGIETFIQPKAFDVLVCLIKNQGRVVQQSEIINECWSGKHIERSTIHTCISTLRKHLGDTDHSIINTIYGIGYCFAATVDFKRSSSADSSELLAMIYNMRNMCDQMAVCLMLSKN